MKYLKILGLAAIAAAALMAFAGSASATELTSPSGTMVTTGTTVASASEGHTILDSPIGEIKCNSNIEGTTSNTGGPPETVSIVVKIFTLSGCTDGADATVLTSGILEFHGISGTHNSTVTWRGLELTVELFGAHCIFEAGGIDIGTLTGSSTTNRRATFHINARLTRKGGRSGALCGSSSPWTGSYEVNSPEFLDTD